MTTIGAAMPTDISTRIDPPDESWRLRARVHLNTLTKPLGSLGKLEDLAAQLVAIHRQHLVSPLSKVVYVFRRRSWRHR